jgi:hypothetical protein
MLKELGEKGEKKTMSENNYEFQIVTQAGKSVQIGEWLEKYGQDSLEKNYGVDLRQTAQILYEIGRQADKEIDALKTEIAELKESVAFEKRNYLLKENAELKTEIERLREKDIQSEQAD